jgi:hypothetical protein
MPWVWFITVFSLCVSGTYWIVSGQQAEPVEALVAWLSISPVAPVFGIPVTSLGLPLPVQAAISFVAAGLVGIAHAYLPAKRALSANLILFLGVRLLAWRVTQALIAPNHSLATVLSLVWLFFEVVSLVVFMAWWYRHQSLKMPTPLPVLHRPTLQSVRIVVWVDRQPMHLVNQSIQSALGVHWPDKTLTVMDLNKRLDVAALCRKLGKDHTLDYWSTAEPQTLHKALNTLLELSNEPFVLWLKAGDLLPPNALMAGMPYVQQDTATFVQFGVRDVQPDVLQRNLKLETTTNSPATEQQWLSYVADAANGLVPCLGSGTLMARTAGPLEKTWLKTGIRWQQGQKRKAFFAPHIVVLSHTANNFGDWLAERLAQQQQQLAAMAEALTPALGPVPRLRLAAIGFQALRPWLCWGLWLLPLVSLYTGSPIIPASLGEVAMYYVPFLLALHFGYPMLTRQLSHRVQADLYTAADCLLPAWPLRPEQTLRFRETSFLHWRWSKTPLMLAAITILGLFVGLARQWHAPDGAIAVFIISALWAGYNLVLLGGVSLIARERRETRLMPRLSTPLRGLLTLPDSTIAIGQVVNLSESGLELQFDVPVPTVGVQTLTLLDWPDITPLIVSTVHSVVEGPGIHFVGFRILQRPDSQRQQLVRHLCRAKPPRIKPVSMGTAWGLIATLPFWLQGRPEIANRRRMPRFPMTLSAVLEHNQQYHVCFTQTISEHGASIVLKTGHGLAVDDTASLRVQWPDNAITTFQVQLLNHLPQLENDVLSFRFMDVSPAQAQVLIKQLYQPSQHIVRVAPALNRQVNIQATLPDGQTVRGVTLSVCEKGIIATLANVDGLVEGQAIPVAIQWDDALPMSPYMMQIMAINPVQKHIMVYFTDQTAEHVMALSQAMAPPPHAIDNIPVFLAGKA